MIELHDWAYRVDMGCGQDSWRLQGKVYDHPNVSPGEYIMTSTPVEFNEQEMTLKTVSGRLYKLMDCDGNLTEQVGYIKEDVARGATLIINGNARASLLRAADLNNLTVPNQAD